MNSFYVNLQAELADAKEELWVQTQIDGAEAGKKILLKGELKDTDSSPFSSSGRRAIYSCVPAEKIVSTSHSSSSSLSSVRVTVRF